MLKIVVEGLNVNINEFSLDGFYFLYCVVSVGSFESFQYFVIKGVYFDVCDRDGLFFFDVVVCEGEFDCVCFLIEKGVNIICI